MKYLKVVVLPVLVAAIAFVLVAHARADRTDSFSPFTASQKIGQETQVVAQKSDGTFARNLLSVNGESMRYVLDPHRKKNISYNPRTGYFEFPITKQLFASVTRQMESCASVAKFLNGGVCNISSETIHGIPVNRIDKVVVGDSGIGKISQWVAPSLACFVMREEVFSPQGERTVNVDTNWITLSDPDPLLFAIPQTARKYSDYGEYASANSIASKGYVTEYAKNAIKKTMEYTQKLKERGELME